MRSNKLDSLKPPALCPPDNFGLRASYIRYDRAWLCKAICFQNKFWDGVNRRANKHEISIAQSLIRELGESFVDQLFLFGESNFSGISADRNYFRGSKMLTNCSR